MRTLLLCLAVTLGLAMALPAKAFDLFNMRNSLIQFALEQISTDDFTITAENVESPGDGVTELVGVEIADRQGVWFTAERLGLQWNAQRILRAELEINRLSAAGVRVLRQPEGEVEVREDAAIAEDDGEPFDWPRSPIATRVDELRLERVFIAEGVIAPQPIAFDATGSARDEGDVQAVDLTVTRTDAIEGRIALAYLRDFAANTLSLDLNAAEAPGGLVAVLAGLPERAASEMTIDASGPLTDWALDFRAETDRVVTAEGTARIDLEGQIAARADFVVRPGPDMGPDATALLAPEARFMADIAEDDGGIVRVNEGALRSPALQLSAAGTLVRATTEMDLAVELRGQSGLSALIDGVAFESFGFAGQVAGTPKALDARGEITLAGLETAPADVGNARLDGAVRRTGERIELALTGEAGRLRLDRLSPEIIGTADLAVNGSFTPDLVVLEKFQFASPLLVATATGEVRLAEESAALDYELMAADLAPIATAYGADASGAARIAGRADGPLAAIRVAGEAALERIVVEGERYGAVRLTHDIVADETPGGMLALTAEGSPYGPLRVDTGFELADERLRVSDLTGSALGVSLAGDAVYALDTGLAEGEIAIDAADLAPLAAVAGAPVTGALSGTLGFRPRGGAQDVALDLVGRRIAALGARLAAISLDGDLTDALGAPALTGRITLSDAAYEDATLARAEGRIEGRDLTGTPALDIDLTLEDAAGFDAAAERVRLTATIEDAATLGQVDAQVTAEGLGFTDIQVAGLEATLSGAEMLAPVPRADLDATATGIAAAGARIGRAELDATLSDTDPAGRLDAALTTGPIEAEGARVASALLAVGIAGVMGDAPVLDVRAETGEVSAADLVLEAVVATLSGPLTEMEATAESTGALGPDPVSLDTAARIALGSETRVTVSQADAAFGEERISLNRPLVVRAAGGTTQIQDIDIAFPGGGLTGTAALYANGLAADIRLAMADLGLLERLADVAVTDGSLDLAADLDTRPGRAAGDVRIDAPGLRFADVLGAGALDLGATALWDGREATVDAALNGPFQDPVHVTAAVPLRATGEPLPAIPASAELAATIRWAGRIGDLWALVPAPGHVLDGDVVLDLQANGPLDDLKIGGEVSLSDGRYENLDLGTILTELTVQSTIERADRFVLDLAARDGAAGRLEGRIALEETTLDARIEGREAVLVRRDDATAAISLDIAAAGPVAAPDISGTVTVDRAEIRLVNATPPSVVTLGDVRIKGEPAPEKPEPLGEEIDLDVAIRGPRNIFVRGRGLDSEWRINMDVGGTAAAPRVTGAIQRIRGRLDLIGTGFELERGEIRFSGATPVDPNLDVRLAAENDGITGFINVTGRASDPQLSFTSQPALPESEVLPRTLFGKSQQSLDASQALRLAAGVSTLLDGSGGLVDRVRGTVGLDQLAIDPTEGGADVTVGKNISDDVFVGAKQPIGGEGEPRVTVEVEVFNNVTIDGEVEPNGDSSVGVNWKTDF